ncbi:dTMP kinase [Halorientalis regularis]|jgi:dTMP kinase|uniref:Probable thymidylate kinase n=1 Tax=Halorientalis regularis TaxID=660518 RepID=A0A1G7HN50_9EURY|nr:dTMP kinase [Halorientalis regularis]SDF01910.1 thymidylate kinase [Halorientalis regularis]
MLITLEGIDGSGKTTVWEGLRGELDGGVTFTREPTDSWYGEAVARSIGDDDADPLAELFLYTADHADHLSRVVKPALEAGDLVISDRYSDSRYAYQGATLEGTIDDPMAYVQRVHDPFTRAPDLTLYFDVDPETGADRSGATNKFEAADYLARVQDNYERLIETDPDRFVRIDATQSPEAVLATARDEIERRR